LRPSCFAPIAGILAFAANHARAAAKLSPAVLQSAGWLIDSWKS
jgi:hypothetical protein